MTDIIANRRMTHIKESYADLQYLLTSMTDTEASTPASIYRMALEHAADAFRTGSPEINRQYNNKALPARHDKVEHTIKSYANLIDLRKRAEHKARIQLSQDCVYRLALEMLAESCRDAERANKVTRRSRKAVKETAYA